MAFPKQKKTVPRKLPVAVELEHDEPVEVTPENIPVRQRRKYLPWFVLAVVVIVSVLLAGFLWLQRTPGSGPLAQLGETSPSPTPEPEEPAFTVVLVGYGGAGHDGSYLTDSIVVARILLEQKRVLLLSLPRDLWVEITNENGQQQRTKINAAYTLGGPNELKRILSDVTGWNIDRYVGIDFSGFTEAIDVLGGVEIPVERSFDDYEYPIAGREDMICEEMRAEDGSVLATPSPAATDGATSVADQIAAGTLVRDTLPKNVKDYPCRYEHLHFDAGRQTLTGVQALKYARSRHSAQDGNDFGRSRRQQLLIQSVRDQIFRVGFLGKIPGVYSSLRSHIATDLSALEMTEWVAKAPELRGYPITSLALTDQNYVMHATSADRQFTLQPRLGDQVWDHIRNWLAFASQPKAELIAPIIEIVSTNSQRSQAEAWRTLLQTELHVPVSIRFGNVRVKTATTSAQVQALHPRVSAASIESIRALVDGVVLPAEEATDSANVNGPHVQILLQP